MENLIHWIDRVNGRLGEIFSWSTIVLLTLIVFNVVLRYVFDRSIIWLVELETYFFAFSFILVGAYAFKEDTHVRVDLFYSTWSEKRRAWINLLGGILFLLPWCTISIMVCWRYFLTSYKLSESSAQAGGLPAQYVLKFCMVLGFTLLLLQGFSSILKSIVVIRNRTVENA